MRKEIVSEIVKSFEFLTRELEFSGPLLCDPRQRGIERIQYDSKDYSFLVVDEKGELLFFCCLLLTPGKEEWISLNRVAEYITHKITKFEKLEEVANFIRNYISQINELFAPERLASSLKSFEKLRREYLNRTFPQIDFKWPNDL